MTKFEIWKESLTPDTFLRGPGGREVQIDCQNCPALEYCEDKMKGYIYGMFDCGEVFLEWAYQEVR
jgi:hypothetical protein